MSRFTIVGTGRCLPDYTVSNSVFASRINTSDEWITTRTGIRTRHFLKGERLQDIAVKAAERALENANLQPRQLDLILCATLQGDDITPSLACLVQKALGADCPAFDLNAACSGFLYALDIADSYFQSGKVETVLIVCAEQMSKFLDWEDRSTCVLFGDGAGAAVLSKGDSPLYLRVATRGQREHLNIPAGAPTEPFVSVPGGGKVSMNGQEIFKFAVTTALKESKLAVQSAHLALDDVDLFLLHQANGRIIEAVRSGLGQPEQKFPTNFACHGNTSSASIPMLLDELNGQNRLLPGTILLLLSFGAGLTSGVCLLKWGG